MRVLLDTNVVLDLLLRRAPWEGEVLALQEAAERHGVVFCVTSLTIANVFYICRRQVGTTRALECVRSCLELFDVLSVGRQALESAVSLGGIDYEDNMP